MFELLQLQGRAGNRAVAEALDVHRDGPDVAQRQVPPVPGLPPTLKVIDPGTAFIRSGLRFDLRYDPSARRRRRARRRSH